MKKYFLLFSFLITVSQFAHAQTYVVIPDANFRAELKALLPACFDANSKMDITCSGVLNLTDINVDGKNISSINGIEYFTKLQTLHCSDNNIRVIEGLPATLMNLIANNNKIETVVFPSDLVHIELDNNLIVHVPEFPATLEYFSINNNSVTTLPVFPVKLSRLFLGNNNLTTIPSFPEGMYDISCYNNRLTSLPDIPLSLSALFCGSNFLTSLPAIPEMTLVDGSKNCFTPEYINSVADRSLVSLKPNRADCNPVVQDIFVTISDVYFRAALKELFPSCFNSGDQMNIMCADITSATTLELPSANIIDITGIEHFSSLAHLNLNNNSISDLSNLPPNLNYLDCSVNALTTLSDLPDNIITLHCKQNVSLTAINNLPGKLEYLDCSDNIQLNALSDLPLHLETLLCDHCSLTALPALPNSLIHLDCSNNFLKEINTVTESNARVSAFAFSLPGKLESLHANNNCFETTPVNPNPTVLTTFDVSPNRTDCALTTGVAQAESGYPHMYPNPASDKIHVVVPAEATLVLYNATGKIVLQKTVLTGSEVDIHSLPAGMYYYTIGNESGKLVIK